MARSFTIAQLKSRARARADMRNSNFISDDELLDIINECYAELYDTLVLAFQHYYIETTTLSLTTGTTSYALPTDFYKLVTLDLQQGSAYESIFPYNEAERNGTLATDSTSIPTGTVRVRYIPAPTVYTDDAETVDGISGWEALLVTDVAIAMLDMEESDTSALERRRQRLQRRIDMAAQSRDITMPGQVTDVSVYDNQYLKDSLRYRFYGDSVEFINVTYIGV